MVVKIISVVASVLLCLGLLSHIAGMSTNYWVYHYWSIQKGTVIIEGDVNYGLWKFCGPDDNKCIDLETNFSELKYGKLDACRISSILGVLAGSVALCFAVAVGARSAMGKGIPKSFGIATLVAALVSGVFIAICIGVFYHDHAGKLGYSFYLSLVGAPVIAVGGALGGVLACVAPNKEQFVQDSQRF